MSHSSAGNTPEDGDVIIRQMNTPSRRYTLGTSPEGAQFSCGTYAEALRLAVRFARTHHVDIWRTEDERSFERLADPHAGAASRKRSRARPAVTEQPPPVVSRS